MSYSPELKQTLFWPGDFVSVITSWLFAQSNASEIQDLDDKDTGVKPHTWDSARYIDNLNHYPPDECWHALHTDIVTCVMENIFQLPEKVMTDYSRRGVGDRYTGSWSARNFVDHLKKVGADSTRARFEYWTNQVAFEKWLYGPQYPEGSQYITISPRGSKIEGYPGTDPHNWVYINIFTKNKQNGDKTTCTYTQLTSYAYTDALMQLHTQLQAEGAQVINSAARMSQVLSTAHQLSRENWLISHPLMNTSSTLTLQRIKELTYAGESTWVRKRHELPQVDEHLAHLQLETGRQFFKKIFDRLVSKQIHSEEFARGLTPAQLLDQAYAAFAAQLGRWTQDNAKNAEYLGLTGKPVGPLTLEKLEKLWQLKCKEINKTLTVKEKKQLTDIHLSSVALNKSGAFEKLLGYAHCNITNEKMLSTLLQSPISPQSLMNSTGVPLFNTLEKSQAKELLQKGFVPLQFTNPRTGKKQTWYIAKEHAAIYWEKSYFDDNGVLMGPCNYPLSLDKFAMSEAEYLRWMAYFDHTSQENDESLASDQTKNDLMRVLALISDPELKLFVMYLYEKALESLLPSVSLQQGLIDNQLYSNDIYPQALRFVLTNRDPERAAASIRGKMQTGLTQSVLLHQSSKPTLSDSEYQALPLVV